MYQTLLDKKIPLQPFPVLVWPRLKQELNSNDNSNWCHGSREAWCWFIWLLWVFKCDRFLQSWQDHRGVKMWFESISTKWKYTSDEGWEGGDHLPAGHSRQCQGFCPCASEKEKRVIFQLQNQRWREREAVCWRRFLGDGKNQGEVSKVQHNPNPVEHTMKGKKRFLVDGIVTRRPTKPNVIMALFKTPLRRWW